MKRIGICQKCGLEKVVRDHHIYGYGSDEVVPYCIDCDRKAHQKARENGKCKLNHEETNQLSKNSYGRRSIKRFTLSYSGLEPNVQLVERLKVNLNTNHLTIWSCFEGTNHKKLKIIDEL